MADRLPDDTSNLPGGLFVKRDRPKNLGNGSSSSRGGSSGGSRLGLDRLAQEKARERGEAAAAAPMLPPPPKRPMLSHLREDDDADADGADGGGARKYRRPREETPSHAGGVNVATAQRIKERVHERLKGAGQAFTTTTTGGGDAGGSSSDAGGASTGGTGTTRQWQAAASPALSMGGSEWEAPSPMHPSLVPDRAQFGSEPRGFNADTPLDTPFGSRGGGAASSASAAVPRFGPAATPQPTPLHPGSSGGAGGEVGDEWERGSVAGDGGGRGGGGGDGGAQEDAAEADERLDHEWYVAIARTHARAGGRTHTVPPCTCHCACALVTAACVHSSHLCGAWRCHLVGCAGMTRAGMTQRRMARAWSMRRTRPSLGTRRSSRSGRSK